MTTAKRFLHLNVRASAPLLLALGLAFTPQISNAQVLFGYNFDTADNGDLPPLTPSLQPLGATLSAITLNGVSQDNQNGQDFLKTGPWPETGFINLNTYLEFTITPDPGNQVTYNQFVFDHRIGGGGGLGPNTLRINAYEGLNPPIGATPVRTADFSSQSQSFEPLSYPSINLTTAQPLTVRFYGWNAGDGAAVFDLDNVGFPLGGITVSPIPEPSFYATVAGLGLVGFAAVRRRLGKSK